MIGPEFDHTKMLQLDDLDLTLMIWRSLMDIWKKIVLLICTFLLYFQIHTVSQSRLWPHDHLRCIIWNDFWGIRILITGALGGAQLIAKIFGKYGNIGSFFVVNYTLSLLTSRIPTQHRKQEVIYFLKPLTKTKL